MRALTVALVVVAASVCAMPAAGQASLAPTTPRFQEIARRAQEGYGDSARASIAAILNRTVTTDPTYPEALYTAGAVARTGDSMRIVFAKLVVEFSSSAWADKALVRLAQLEYGYGNMDKVVADITLLFNDYSRSPVLATGALWGARAAFAQQKAPLGCGWLTKGVAAAGDDLELKNQLQFAKQSCNIGNGVQYAPQIAPESLRLGPPPAHLDTATHPSLPPPPPPPPPTPPAPTTGKRPVTSAPVTKAPPAAAASPWRVQVAAISDKNVIARVVKTIEAAGFKAYTVPGPNGLTKIQAGPFATRAAAVAGLPKVKAAVGGSPIVVAAP